MSVAPGQKLAHYRLVEKLGEGGMGVVWMAVDSRLDREVAIKLLPESFSEHPTRLERFEREAKAVAALNHPNIVTIHGIEEADGQRFLVMERVEGQSLDRIIPPSGFPVSEVFDLAIPIADALAAAHEKKIVHRDVKPANVMVTPEGWVKVLDFGLAKLAAAIDVPDGDERADAATRTKALTGEGVVVGTAPYMSPEQLQGRDVDQRTDVFSLGVMLYEMLCGKRPFQGDSGLDLASSILKDQPSSVTDERADLPRHLGRIVRQCLEKKPEQRFQTVRDVRNQLEALRQETASGELPSPRAVPQRPRSTGRRVATGAAALLILGLAGYGLWQALAPTESNTPPVAAAAQDRPTIVVLPFENLGQPEDEYFADGITEEITSRLASLGGLAVISRTSAMQYKDSRPALQQIGEDLGADYVLEGTVRWQHTAGGPSEVRVTPQLIQVSDDTHLWTERYTAVLANIFDVQSDIAKQVCEQLGLALVSPQLATLSARPTESLEAYDYYLRGNEYLNRGLEVTSKDNLRYAIRLYDDALRTDPSFALAWARKSVAHSRLGEPYESGAESAAAAARSAVDRALQIDAGLPEAHHALGLIYSLAGDQARALEEFQTVLASEPNNAEVYEAISSLQSYLGQYPEALASMKKAMELNPRLGRLACEAGGWCLAMRDFDQSLSLHSRAIRLTPDRACPYYCVLDIHVNRDGKTAKSREVLAELPPNITLEGDPPLNYAWLRLDMIDGEYEKALERLEEGTSKAYVFSPDNYYIPKDQLKAQIHGLLGSPELEAEHYLAARDLLEARIEARPDEARLRTSLGIVYAGLGLREDAVREGKLGLELNGANRSVEYGQRLKDMAQIYVMVGDTDRAIDQLELLLSVPTVFAAPLLAVDPTWQALREDPRFLELIREYQPAPTRG